MKKIVIMTYGNFPNGEAASVRIFCLAKCFMECGLEPYVISMSRVAPQTWMNYDGVKYISIRKENAGTIRKFLNYISYGILAKKIVKKIHDVEFIMPLSLPLNALVSIEKYAKKNKIQLVTDRTEWYSSSEFSLGYLSLQYQQNNITNKYIIDRAWKVISISTYLENYYLNKGISTIRVPAIMDIKGMPPANKKTNDKVIIVYAGSPAKKDSLLMMVEGIEMLEEKYKNRIEFKVIGVDEKKFRATYDYQGNTDSISFYGRVDRSVVIKELENADFATLMRDPQERFTKAGFPSKVAESMSLGIPMICNYTSDLSQYLVDETNAVIVPTYSKEAYSESIKRVSVMNHKEIEKIKLAAAETAAKVFDYENYIKALEDFLKG